MRRVNDVIEQVFYWLGAILFAVFIVVIFIQVVARNYLSLSLVWTDEVALFCFVWSVFLGSAVAVRRRVHYVVDILPDRLVTANNVLRLFATLACLVVIYVFVVPGGQFANMGMRRFSVALGMPLFYLLMAFPVAGIAMALFSIELITEDWRALRRGEKTGGIDPETVA